MQIPTNPTFRKVAAGSALALAATGAALITSPAEAATSPSLSYSCSQPQLGEFTVTATHAFGDTVQYGGDLAVTSTLTLPESVVGGLNFFGVKKIDGTSDTFASLEGVQIQTDQAFPKTDVPASGTMNVAAAGTADTAPSGGVAQAGDVADLALVDTAAGDLTAEIFTYDASGAQGGPFVVTCELNDDQVLTVGTVSITQAVTETTAKLSYANKAGKLVAKGLVDAPASGASVVGDVKLIIKRNGKAFDSVTVPLNGKETAVAKLAAPKKGNYKLVAKYLGDDNFMASQDDITKSFA